MFLQLAGSVILDYTLLVPSNDSGFCRGLLVVHEWDGDKEIITNRARRSQKRHLFRNQAAYVCYFAKLNHQLGSRWTNYRDFS